MAKDFKGDENRDINIAREVFDETHFSEGACSSPDEPKDLKHKIRAACARLTSCSVNGFRRCLWNLFPILDWLPKYKLKEDLLPDITGGITVGIMHIPQGLAFAMLATLPPVTGMYTALIPVLVYMLMGTSRHLSVGSFAVISLMVAQVCEREVGSQSASTSPSPAPVNASSFSSAGNTSSSDGGDGPWSPSDTLRMQVAVTLAFLVGIFQIAMGAARLGFLATFLSDPLISGFTTGSAVLVVISQLKHIFGLAVPRFIGPLSSVKVIIHILKNIASSNVGAIITGVLCLLVLIGLRYINDKYKSKMKFPVPGELLVVIVGTGISYGATINAKYGVSIIGDIPKGLPPLSVPSMSVLTNIIPDAFVIAVVIFATNISISKIFATKRGYKVEPNQELIAYGVGNAAGSFFSCFPICNALARTAVQENLANTQLCDVIVIILILMVLLFIAPLFFHLPKAILASVIIANLVGLLKQFSRLRVLWKIYMPDAVVWFITCFGVILLGVDNGLGAGVICALFVVVLTLSRSSFSVLGQVSDTELYRDVKEYSLASEVPGVKILKFQSTLYFGNAEGFRNAFVAATGVDPSSSTKQTQLKNNGLQEKSVLLEKERAREDIRNYGVIPAENYTVHIEAPAKDAKPPVAIHTVVLDCSGFNFIDSVGMHTLPSLIQEFDKVGVRICLAGVSGEIKKRLDAQSEGASKNIPPHMMFPSIHDAVLSAVRSHKQPDQQPEDNVDPKA